MSAGGPPRAAAPDADPAAGVERAKRAVAVAFAANGFAFASWASRTPALRDGLDLSSAQLGLLLLCLSAGSVCALPLSGPVVHRTGPARAVLLAAAAVAAGLVALAAALAAASVPVAVPALALTGLGIALWDVAMNVEGADVEHRRQRPLMPRLHAAFSLGTVAGAAAGAGAAAAGVPLPAQLVAAAALTLVAVALAVRAFSTGPRPGAAADAPSGSGTGRAWRERRTLLIGLCVLAFAFTEGTANDWLAVAVVDGYGTSEATGAIGFGVFVTAMTASRMAGVRALGRWGRVPVLRATTALSLVGLLLVVLGPALPWALAGALVWGAGAALGFPVGMSAAADDPQRAAARVSVVSSIGYTAFLAGPPLVGFVGDEVGVLRALLVVVGPLAVGLLVVGATAPLAPGAAAPDLPPDAVADGPAARAATGRTS